MSGNSFGTLFCVTSFGESHGPAYGGVVDGCPPGLELSSQDLQKELDRRKPGSSRHVTQRRESDAVEILSGVYEGRTTGTAIGFLVRNEDQRPKDYAAIAQKFRPGHADYTYFQKYGARDPRGGGRASARETVVRVAAGAIAKKWLKQRYGVAVRGYLAQLGPEKIDFESWQAVDRNPFFAPNLQVVSRLEKFMDELRESGDSCGARVNVVAEGVPVGWGEPVYGRLDADIAAAMMSINAVKGVEIGAGVAALTQKGSEHGDEMTPRASSATTTAACSAASRPARTSACRSRSSPLPASGCRAGPSTARAGRPPSRPPGGTIPASASAPPPSPRPCSPAC